MSSSFVSTPSWPSICHLVRDSPRSPHLSSDLTDLPHKHLMFFPWSSTPQLLWKEAILLSFSRWPNFKHSFSFSSLTVSLCLLAVACCQSFLKFYFFLCKLPTHLLTRRGMCSHVWCRTNICSKYHSSWLAGLLSELQVGDVLRFQQASQYQ